MKSNVEILKATLEREKEGNVAKTIAKICIEYGRNSRNVKNDFELLAEIGFIVLDKRSIWYDECNWHIND
jgi:hypothetical protein